MTQAANGNSARRGARGMSQSYQEIRAEHAEAVRRRKSALLKGSIALWLVLAALWLFVHAVIVVLLYWEAGVTVQNFRRLQVGMNEAAVESLLGEQGEEIRVNEWENREKRWRGDKLIITVAFDTERRAKHIWVDWLVAPPPQPAPSFADKVRDWLVQLRK
jgi:hypothetical protein